LQTRHTLDRGDMDTYFVICTGGVRHLYYNVVSFVCQRSVSGLRWTWIWTWTWIYWTTTTTMQMIMCSSIVVAAE